MERVILHCDLNNFFASVECRDHPELCGKAVAVCGSVEDRHGIVLAKNELAKSFGIKTAEPVWQAKKKCPDLLIVPPHFDRYLYFSDMVKQIYLSYTNQVEPFSIDECWLDVTGSTRLFGSGPEMADQIRARTKSELGLSVSVGVSFNKIFAKLGSDLKKPDATTVITRENFREKVWPLSADSLLGVGKVTGKHLNSMGIKTIGDLAGTDSKYIRSSFGKMGYEMWKNANGLDNSEVSAGEVSEIPKSIGNSITCVHDLFDMDEIWPILLYLAEKISFRMRSAGVVASGIQLTIKDNRLHVSQHQMQLEIPTRLTMDLALAAKEMFRKSYCWACPVRALGISGFSLLPESETQQTSLFHSALRDEKMEQLESRLEHVRNKYGKASVKRAALMEKLPLPTGHGDQK
ncbi:DNA polymerase IV [Caproiciproducens faecalis]|uniref:DNA polymerase IV n=1 Tax=Caproiciproducens faecalis TaxID=2820301 RepID=A0ABS7DQG6_9FIRM|nr:DNA polymerase IV [Caproiciproducens faecalis]MBW7573389.1 DNA polymerase IV [Caproiciproducens faecalis]